VVHVRLLRLLDFGRLGVCQWCGGDKLRIECFDYLGAKSGASRC
jgi:hypothetical protein